MESSEIYLIPPTYPRNLEIEMFIPGHPQAVHNRENAYQGNARKDLTKEQKEQKYDDLKESIQTKGFDRLNPILIMIKRKNKKDEIVDGHHRLQIAIELELPTVPVRFLTKEKPSGKSSLNFPGKLVP